MNGAYLDSPIFVIGNPRSGTSLLRLILTSHSQVLIPPECGFIIWLSVMYSGWVQSDSCDPVKLKKYLDDLFACKKFETWKLEREKVERQITFRQPANYAELCSVIYEAFGTNFGKKFTIWGDKNNFHINHLRDLLDLYSKARFLHIVRDGRDVACSYREVMEGKSNSPYAPKLNTGIEEIALEWASNVMKVDSFITSMPDSQAMTIRYEDMATNPQPAISSMCEWLGLEFEKEMLNFYQQNRDMDLEPNLTLDWKKRTTEPISRDTVGRYKTVLTNEEKTVFLSVANPVLCKFRYE